MRKFSAAEVAIALLLIVLGAALAFVHHFGTALSCGTDTSNCAESTEKNGVYAGVLRDLDGAVYRSAGFEVAFESRSREDLPKVHLRTDGRGRYCVVWPRERVVPFPSDEAGTLLSGRDEPLIGLGDWRDLEGADPPPGCEETDAGIPWNRADDAESSWQYWLLLALPITAALAAAMALATQRTRLGRPLLLTGSALFVADLAIGAVLWNAL